MIIYKHRCNTIKEIELAVAHGLGIEIDLRSSNGKVFLSHDPILHKFSYASFEEAVRLIEHLQIPTILNFKETGIVHLVAPYCKTTHLYYASDLIFPDQLICNRLGLRSLSRTSFYETIFKEHGFWLDYTFSDLDLEMYSEDICRNSILVSPELHKRPLTPEYRSTARSKNFIGVCTDDHVEWWAR